MPRPFVGVVGARLRSKASTAGVLHARALPYLKCVSQEDPMPRPAKTTLAKRTRERDKQMKRKEKESRRAQRNEEKRAVVRPSPSDGEDPDLAGMYPGPQAPLY